MLSYHEITALYVGGSNPYSFPTIAAALEYVRELRRIGVGQPVSIRLTSDTYSLSAPITIDSGISDVTIEPFGDRRVSILGGVELTGFEWDTYNGKRCLSAPLPDVCRAADGGCAFTDLYVNGSRASFTRYPAEGYLYPEDVENHEGQLFSGSKWFTAAEGDIRDFKNIDRVQISFCHYWIDEHTPIDSYDPETRRVTFRYRSRFNIDGGRNTSSGLEYYMENVAEMFANPNEWYADGGRVYYIPRDDSITPETIRAFAPTLHKLTDVRGTPDKPVHGIRFRNIDFAVTRGEYGSLGNGNVSSNGADDIYYASDAQAVSNADGSVTFKYAANCSLEGCTLKNFGVHGIVIDLGCHNIRILSCDLYDGGAGGVKIIGGAVGSPETDHTHDNVIDDCTILHCGKRYFAACGVLLIHTYNNTISHNDIGHLYYTGVSVGWIWGYFPNISRDNIITKNHIHHLGGGMLSDMGGVYLLGMQPGTIVSNNVIHDVRSKHYGGWALYTDEGSSFITLENNICYNTSNNSYHQHYGSMNTVRNNIFAFSEGQMLRVSRTEAHLSIIFEGNIVYSAGVPMYDISRAQIAQKTVASSRNVFFDCTRDEPIMRNFGDEKLTLAELQAAGLEDGSIVANPCFVSAEDHDFTLREDSPALKLGFRPIDTSDVGSQRSAEPTGSHRRS